MAYAIVAVGGTGKRVALLYLKLANTLRPANISTPGNSVFVVDMEPDPDTPDGQINADLMREGVPRSHFISPVGEEARVNRTITLLKYMGFDRTTDLLPAAHTLFNSSQLNVQIVKGMNCEPTVGATVAGSRFCIGTREPEVQLLDSGIAAFERVLLVGSIIGGTGAGVTPQLVNWIRGRKPTYGLLYLRWITIPTGDPDEPNDLKIEGNTKAWLNYLIEHHPENQRGTATELFHHYVLIDAPDGMRLSEAGSNSHHPLHLLGAAYLLQFEEFLEQAPGAGGPHYFELNTGLTPDDIRMGDDTMSGAIIRKKLFATLLGEFQDQQPDEALSSFTLILRERLAWNAFTDTLEKIAAKWNRRRHTSEDWKAICRVFDRERRTADDRIEELKKLTQTMDGARYIFDFDWNSLLQQCDSKITDARVLVRRNLEEVPVAFPGHAEALQGVANNFVEQLDNILGELRLP